MAKSFSLKKKYQNPKGSLSSAGRKAYNRATGSNLRPPVKGAAKTPTQLRRKGSFLVRMGSSKGSLFDNKGKKTRLKLSLEAWGYRGKSKSEAVSMGRKLLARYRKTK